MQSQPVHVIARVRSRNEKQEDSIIEIDNKAVIVHPFATRGMFDG
jgi:hypothetical protein